MKWNNTQPTAVFDVVNEKSAHPPSLLLPPLVSDTREYRTGSDDKTAKLYETHQYQFLSRAPRQ